MNISCYSFNNKKVETKIPEIIQAIPDQNIITYQIKSEEKKLKLLYKIKTIKNLVALWDFKDK